MTDYRVEILLRSYKDNLLKVLKESILYDNNNISNNEKVRLCNKLDIATNYDMELCIQNNELAKLRKKLFANKKILKLEYKNRVTLVSGGFVKDSIKREISVDKITHILLDYLVNIKAYDVFIQLLSEGTPKFGSRPILDLDKKHIFIENYLVGLYEYLKSDTHDFLWCVKNSYHYNTPRVVKLLNLSIPVGAISSAMFIRSMLSYIIDDIRLNEILAQRVLLGRKVSGVKMKEEDLAYALVEIIERHYGILSLHDFYML